MWKSSVKSQSARGSARSTSTVIASTPLPAGPFSDNWRASSAAVAELAEGLDFIFDQVNYEEDPSDLLRLHLERLSEEAAKYQNSRLDDFAGEEWSCPRDVAQLLYAACQCSCLVYDPMAHPGPELIPVMTRAASVTGRSKAVAMWKVAKSDTLIVSIRGTASPTDHMVNLNSESQDASSIVSSWDTEKPIQAHKGFLVCAMSLIPYLLQEISRQLEMDAHISHIIFTGHSAGGSVSSLIFLHLVSQTPAHLSAIRFSLATFGCAPVVSSHLNQVTKRPNVGWALAFVNEYDIVPRADRPYLRSLVDLYRSRHGLPCVNLTPPNSAEGEEYKPTLAGLVNNTNLSIAGHWPLPPSEHQLVGDIIVLRRRFDMTTVLDDAASGATLATTSLRVNKVSPEDFSKLIFCDVGVHKRRVYLERMETIATGGVRELRSRQPTFASDSSTLYTATEDLEIGDIPDYIQMFGNYIDRSLGM